MNQTPPAAPPTDAPDTHGRDGSGSRVASIALRRARLWMTAGLAASSVGSSIMEGGSDGLVAAATLPVVWIAVVATVSEGLAFASPLIASWLGRFSPGKVLVWSETTEAVMSALALIALLTAPQHAMPILMVYICTILVFPAITDVVEEFYGQQIAQKDAGEALKFNASIYSILAFIGLVLAMPTGAVLASISPVWMVTANLALSGAGGLFRLVSARAVLTSPVTDQDPDEWDAFGPAMKSKQFLSDLTRTGPVSPLLDAVVQVGATMAGIYVYLWMSSTMPWSGPASLALVIMSFGIGATIGPWGAPLLRRYWDARTSLLITYAFGTILVGAALILVLTRTGANLPNAWIAGPVYVFLVAVFSRTRGVLTTTLRQEDYTGRQFTSIMGWTFSLGAAGGLLGAWAGVGLAVDEHPGVGLGTYLAVIIVGLVVVARHRPGPVAADTGVQHPALD